MSIGVLSETHFIFKFVSSIKDGNVDIDNYQLLFDNGIKGSEDYIPADSIMPKEDAAIEKEGYDSLDFILLHL